ncbi:MAG: hypothetical protein U0401_05730 [Anaerolineae bacterium]
MITKQIRFNRQWVAALLLSGSIVAVIAGLTWIGTDTINSTLQPTNMGQSPILSPVTPTTTGVAGGPNELILTDAFEGVIFSQENAAAQRIDNRAEGYWTPSRADVLQLEARLGAYLAQAAPSDYPGPLLKLAEYQRQYVGLRLKGQQVILANFFCEVHQMEWQSDFVFVADGGPCFFEVKYNPQTENFFDLSIHGQS